MPRIKSGQDSNAKVIHFKPYIVEGSTALYELSQRMSGLLLQASEYLNWRTRWETMPEELEDKDARDAYVSDLQLRLMKEVEFCNEVINCLDTDTDVKQSVRKVTNNYNYYGTNPGTEMTEEELNQDLSNAEEVNPTCDLDILWAQCLAVVQTTNRFIVDVFEKIEAATNAVELADAASDIPIAGEVKNLVGINFVLEMIQYWQNSISEGYNAGYTTEYEQQLTCDLFCVCRTDCQITVQRIFDILFGRVEDRLTLDSVHDIISFLETIFGVTLDGTIVTDIAFFAAWGMVKFSQFLFGSQFDGITLQLVLNLAVNDASNDWELLCEECASCGIDYTVTIGSEDVPPDIVSAATAEVSRIDITGTAFARRIELTFASPVRRIRFGYNAEGALDDMFAKLGNGDTMTLESDDPQEVVITAEVASDTFIVDLGYSGSSDAYADNPARITIVDACE